MELVEEVKVPGFSPTWQGKILISVENYSKENLDKIFTWYSNRHPKEDGKITVSLYINRKDLNKTMPFTGVPSGPNEKEKVSAPFNAVFFRLDEEDNEFYVYDLDPLKKGAQERVVLKGRDPFA